jgi:imidazolonepropionase-like amidohydrolase
MRRIFAAIIALCLAVPAIAQSVIPNSPGRKPTVVIRNATIYPVTSAPITNGTIVFANGVITAVGTNVTAPADAMVIDGTGLSVYPGLIDSGTTIGLVEIDSVPGTVDTTELGTLNPNARADVAVNPHTNVIPVTRVNGITNAIVAPEGGVVSGQSAMIQLAGWTNAEMTLKAPAAMTVRFPRLRTRPLGTAVPDADEVKKQRKSYQDELENLKQLFRNAQAYAKAAGARAADRNVKRFDRDLVLEAMVPVVEGRVPVAIEANLARDIKPALDFAEEFKLKMILVGAQDVAKFIPQLERRNIPVILGPILALPPREDDPYDLLFSNAALLHQAGIRFAFRSNDAHNSRNLPYHAASAAAFGLPKEEALKAITIYPAQIFGVADKIGSLEVGKMANLFIADGDPLEIRTNVRRVFIAGEDISMDSLHTLQYEKFRKRP